MKVNIMKHLLGSEGIFKIEKVTEKPMLNISFFEGRWEVKPAQKIGKIIKKVLLTFGDYCANTSKDRIYQRLNPKEIRVIFCRNIFDKGSQDVRYNPNTSTLFFPDRNTMIRWLEKWGLPITLFDKYVWEKLLTLLRCFYTKIFSTILRTKETQTEKEIRLSKFGIQAPCGQTLCVQPGLFYLKLAKNVQ